MSKISLSVKRLFSPLRETVHNAYIENSDGGARSRREILKENIMYNICATLSGGVFLTGLILYILRDEPTAVQNEYLGLIVSMQLLANAFQLFTPFITRKLKTYKMLILVTRTVYFVVNILGFGILPLLNLPAKTLAIMFIALVFIKQLAIMLVNPAICAWHISNIPDSRRSDWMSVQQMILPAINIVASVAASAVLDYFELKGMYMSAVLITRGVILLLAFFEMKTHFFIKEPEYAPNGETFSLKEMFILPLKCKPYLISILIACVWRILSNFPGQYLNAYLLEDINMSYTLINLCSATNIPLSFMFMGMWNRLVHKKGWMWVMGISSLFYVIPHTLNIFIFENTAYIYLISVIATNIMGPGFRLCTANMQYYNMPKENSALYLSFYNTVAGLIGFLASYLGKEFIGLTEGIVLNMGNRQVVNKQYICLVAGAFCIITAVLCFVTYFKEKKTSRVPF